MYTVEENVRIVISVLKQNNIRHIVISPGGTNIPLTTIFQDDSFFQCYSVVDERSALYFAIGLYWQLGETIAVCCTSAQATRNYIPGLTEAFYKHVPILAITTSKLERYLYQDYMQAPNQTSLPEDSVKKSYNLPYIYGVNDTRILCEQRAKEAILELTRHGLGPVQLNICISDTDNLKFEQCELPTIRPLRLYNLYDDWSDLDLNEKKIMIVIGEHRPFCLKEKNALESFADNYDCFIYCNHLSNYNGAYSINGNVLLSCVTNNVMAQSGLTPDIVISVGGQTGDYPLFGKLFELGRNKFEHWRVCDDGKAVDTYGKLDKIFECPISSFVDKILSERRKCDHSYYNKWQSMFSQIDLNIKIPFSNAAAAQLLSPLIPPNSYVHFAILNSLRVWNLFPLNDNITCSSNVAAFGIDGCLSMLIGESMNTEQLCFLITGDLAFFYDMNALGIRHIKDNVRILLVNNNGGAEFCFMTRNNPIEIDKFISAKGHNGTAEGWAKSVGFDYYNIRGSEELMHISKKFVSKSERPILIELTTDFQDEVDAYRLLVENNKKKSFVDIVKENIKHLAGQKTIDIIKKKRK